MPFDLVLPNMAPGESLAINEAFRELEARIQALESASNGGGDYVLIPEVYQGGEFSRRGRMVILETQPHCAVALRDTWDSPAIFPVGDPEYLTGLPPDDITGYIINVNAETIKRRGQEYRLNQGKSYKVSRMAFLVPSDQVTQSYSIWVERYDPINQDWDQAQVIGRFTNTQVNQWLEFNYAALWTAGNRYRVMLNILPESAPTGFSGYWDQKNTNGNPGEGEMNFQNSETQMRFHKTDENGVDQTSGLESVVPGATIQRGSTLWTVDDVDIRGSHVRYDVSPGGQRGNEDKYTFTFQWGSSDPLQHLEIPNFWGAREPIVGIKQDSNGDEFEDQEQYMLDIRVQEVTVSDDWMIISLE